MILEVVDAESNVTTFGPSELDSTNVGNSVAFHKGRENELDSLSLIFDIDVVVEAVML